MVSNKSFDTPNKVYSIQQKNMHFDPNSVIYQLLIIDLKETESAKYLNKQ